MGERSGTYSDEVSAERIGDFARAVGAVSPGGAAPATYLTTCRKGEFEFFDQLGIPLARLLHVDQEYAYVNPIQGGDRLHYQTRLASAVEKAKGKMLFLGFETNVEIERAGQTLPAGSTKSTIVVR